MRRRMKILVVYYSRTGRTKKAARKIAELLLKSGHEASLEEIVDKKKRSGIIGWIKSGRDATLKQKTVIEPFKANLSSFDLVIVGTPVWAFTVATPVRTACMERAKEMKEVAFYCTMRSSGAKNTFRTLEQLCGKSPLATLALIDKHVWRDDESEFLARTKSFVEELVAALKKTR